MVKIKLFTAVTCSVIFYTLLILLESAEYSLMYFMITGAMFTLIGIPVSLLIDAVSRKFNYHSLKKRIIKLLLYGSSGLIVSLVFYLAFSFNGLFTLNIMVLSMLAALTFYSVESIANKFFRTTKASS